MSAEQVMVFESGGEVFGLDLDLVESVIEKGEVTPVPMAPSVAEGLIPYRKGVLPVISLPRLLGSRERSVGELLVVVRSVSEDFGVSAERIHGIFSPDSLNLEYLSEKGNPHILGKGYFRGKELSLLDLSDMAGMGQSA